MLRQALTGGAAAVVIVVLGFSSGAYFPADWGLLLLAAALVCLAAFLTAERQSLGRLDVALVAALVSLAAWALLSATWASGVDGPVLEAERTLVYAGAAGALLLALKSDCVPSLLSGVAGGLSVLCLYALATRLAPGTVGDSAEAIGGLRLDDPIGYANALGMSAVFAILLLVGLALDAGRTTVRVAASAPLVPLAAVLWLTGSRGAIVALLAGSVVLVALSRERMRALGGLLLLSLPAALAALVTARSNSNRGAASLEAVEAAGQALAWRLALLALVAAAVGALLARIAVRLAPAAVALVVLVLVAGATSVLIKGPVSLADRALEGFRATPPATVRDLDRSLLSLSGSWRADYWRVAWRMVEREPLLGEGGGSYERWWLDERPVASYARDAHSLYLETAGELGLVGVTLLAAVLVLPFASLRRALREPFAAGAAATYAAFLVHAGLDWDWEVPLVTLPALACAASLVVLARRTEGRALGRLDRAVGVSGAIALVGIAFVIHVGNRAAGAAEEALQRGEAAIADDQARRARTWMPWAAQPWQLLGEAQLAVREDSDARSSLREAVKRDPEQWSAWYDLAVASRGRAQVAALARAERLNRLGPEIAELREELRRKS